MGNSCCRRSKQDQVDGDAEQLEFNAKLNRANEYVNVDENLMIKEQHSSHNNTINPQPSPGKSVEDYNSSSITKPASSSPSATTRSAAVPGPAQTGPEVTLTVPNSSSTRFHPYDEITQEQLEENREMARTKAGADVSGQKEVTKDGNTGDVEYMNANVTTADLYSTPKKAKKNGKTPETGNPPLIPPPRVQQLNYIEVEFVGNDPKPKLEVKKAQPSASIEYTSVVTENGVIVLKD